MIPLESALAYAARRWPVFPCREREPGRKGPYTPRGFHDASLDPAIIIAWWRQWPEALIGLPTGRISGFVVLDVDVKHNDANGFDTLAELGHAVLPNTPMSHTASGGLHLYFEPSTHDIRNTGGKRGRGIGPGLDWRGDGGYVILPSPGSGYEWDRHWNPDTAPLASVPVDLLPKEPEQLKPERPIERTGGLSPYAEAALDSACRKIVAARNGEQEATINVEAFAIATLAAAGGIPADFARRALVWAACQAPSYDRRRPWRPGELKEKVNRAFSAGLCHPRQVQQHAQ